jgi:hypothetical protein
MSKLNFTLALNLVTALALAQQTPHSSAPTFRAQSDLVLLPFHVTRRDVYVRDLKAGDVVLLEDGHPRDFSIFEGPDTQRRLGSSHSTPRLGSWRRSALCCMAQVAHGSRFPILGSGKDAG